MHELAIAQSIAEAVEARAAECKAAHVRRVPHRAYCRHCAEEFDVTNFVAQCPTCLEWSAEVVSGNELEILDMEIEPKSQQS